MNCRALSSLCAFALSLVWAPALAAPGAADPSFGGGNGYIRFATSNAMPGMFSAILGRDDGTAIVAGGEGTSVFVRRYRPDGSLDAGFGAQGTTIVPGITAYPRQTPLVRLFSEPQGGILIEQQGLVQRLSADGAYDNSFGAKNLRRCGSSNFSTVLAQADGRLVCVASGQSRTAVNAFDQVVVQFLQADGYPDFSRGGVYGERILNPSGFGVFEPLAALTDPIGKIVILAHWEAAPLNLPHDSGLMLLRLNSDGSYDDGFGQGGTVTFGAEPGLASAAALTVDPIGRIALLLTRYDAGGAVLNVKVLFPNGQPDWSVGPQGSIGTQLAVGSWLGPSSLTFVSGQPTLTVTGVVNLNSAGGAPTTLLWRPYFAPGDGGDPIYSSAGPDTRYGAAHFAGAGNSVIWGVGTALASTGTRTYLTRQTLFAYDTSAFATAVPTRVVALFGAASADTFQDAKALSDGRILVLRGYSDVTGTQSVLSRFNADGTFDSTYARGSGQASANGGSLLRSDDDRATVLSSFSGNILLSELSASASLIRYNADGSADTSFGTDGIATVPRFADEDIHDAGTQYVPGFVGADGSVALMRVSSQVYPTGDARPIKLTATGTADPQFSSAKQTLASANYFQQISLSKLDSLPDGRLQGIIVFRDGQGQIALHVYRWLPNGQIDPASIPNLEVPIPATGAMGAPDAINSLVLPDGRTLVALDQSNQRMLLRLRADGSLDATFGSGGTVAVVAALDANPHKVKLAIESDGKILMSYDTPLGASTALVVARFSVDGQRDATFTVDGRFDSLFSSTGDETASDLLTLPDGRIVVAGRSGDSGLLLELRGTTEPSVASAPLIEFVNTLTGNYLLAASPAEIANVDAGSAGPGWTRTGYSLRAYPPEIGTPAGTTPVCHFKRISNPNAHFYALTGLECDLVKQYPDWTYLGNAFSLFGPTNGQCGADRVAIYRFLNQHLTPGDWGHRYSADPAVVAALPAQGWIPEGVGLCAPPR